MNNKAIHPIAVTILLITFILLTATAASLLTKKPANNAPHNQQQYQQILDNTLKEITTYLQIKNIIGRYDIPTNQGSIQQIAILLSPLFSIQLDLSSLLIQINNGETIQILSYNQHAAKLSEHTLFHHPLWNNLTPVTYSVLPIHDTDNSILHYNSINDQTDMVYLIFTLSNEFCMQKGESLEITLFPSTGTTKTIQITAPMPIKQTVTLY